LPWGEPEPSGKLATIFEIARFTDCGTDRIGTDWPTT